MVAWYKHDIPAWMDATEALDDGPYRVYHVVCQLIYLNEGPIRLNEKGIAGRCNMHVLSFRSHLNLLLTLGRLTLDPSGTLSQPRADLELEKIGQNRVNAGLGGSKSRKPLKSKELDQAPLKSEPSTNITEKTREEKTRQDDALSSVAPRARDLDRPVKSIPRDFHLTEAQIALCRTDTDDATIAERFDKFMNHHTEGEGLSDDWPGVWDRWWPKNKLARGKPRLVMDSNTDVEPKKKRCPIPPDWKPNAVHAALAIAHGLDLAEVEHGFRDGCAANGYRYLDHDAAFRNWIKNQNTFKRGSNGTVKSGIIQAADDLRRKVASFDGPPKPDIAVRDGPGAAVIGLLSNR